MSKKTPIQKTKDLPFNGGKTKPIKYKERPNPPAKPPIKSK